MGVFSPDYATARGRFREAAAHAGFLLLSYPLAARGPQGEELAIDVALKPAGDARRALVISSGTHGVEGYFGSAVQLAALSQLLAVPRPTISLVLIHAINPFGFAHKRRVNEDNVDQNRNFVLDGREFSGAPSVYSALDPLLNPPRVPSPLDGFRPRLILAGLRHGFPQVKSAIAQGQYEFARGLFFGGRAASASQQILRSHLREWLGRPERVLHLDLHTGAGAWGTYALCVDLPREHPRVVRLAREFGAQHVQGFDPHGVLYEIQGALGGWLEQRFTGTQYDCLLAEFGTYPGLRVLSALRLDNCVRHYAPERAALAARARDLIFEMFCPASPSWREQALASGLGIVNKALSALARGDRV
jgi:hypothetical protein